LEAGVGQRLDRGWTEVGQRLDVRAESDRELGRSLEAEGYIVMTCSLGGSQSIVQRGLEGIGMDVASTNRCTPLIVHW